MIGIVRHFVTSGTVTLPGRGSQTVSVPADPGRVCLTILTTARGANIFATIPEVTANSGWLMPADESAIVIHRATHPGLCRLAWVIYYDSGTPLTVLSETDSAVGG